MLFIYHYDNFCIAEAQYIGILCHFTDTYFAINQKPVVYALAQVSYTERKTKGFY